MRGRRQLPARLAARLVVPALVLAAAPPAIGAVGWRETAGPFPWADTYSAQLEYSPSGEAYARASHFVEGGDDNGGHVAVRPRGGAFARIVPHPGDPNLPPLLGFDATGAGTWASTSNAGAQATILAGPGPGPGAPAFGAEQTLGAGDSGGVAPSIAVNDAGLALVPWRRKSDGKLVLSERASSSAAFGPPVTPAGEPAAETFFGAASLTWPVLDADGGGAVVYQSEANNFVFSAVYRSGPSGTFGGATQITPSSGIAGYKLAHNRIGDAVILWREPGGFNQPDTVKAVYRPHGGTFGAPEVVSANPGRLSDQLSVDVTGDGHVVFASAGNPVGVDCHMATVVRRSPGAGGTWTQDEYAGAPDGAKRFFPGGSPRVGASKAAGSDAYVLAWLSSGQACPLNDVSHYATASFGHAGQPFAPPAEPVSPLPGATASPNSNDGDFDPLAAMDPAGNALVVWSFRSGSVLGTGAAAYEDGSSPPPTTNPPPGGNDPPGGNEPPPGGNDPPPGGGDPPKSNIEKILDIGNKSQSVKKFSAIPVEVGCQKSGGVEICQFLVNGRLQVAIASQPGGPSPMRVIATKRKVKTLKIPRFRTSVPAGKRRVVKIPVPKKARKLGQNALKGGGTVKAVLTFQSNQATGKIKRTIRIKLKKK